MFTLSTSVKAEDQALDRIAVVVNSDVIMLSEIRKAAQQLRATQTEEVDQKVLFKQVLDKMIIDKIQVQKAKSIGIKIDDAAVDSAMLRIAKQNDLDLPQLRLAIIDQGLDYNIFREGIRDRLYSDNLRRRQQGRTNIGDNEVDDLIMAESFNLSKDIQYQIVDIVVPNDTNSVKQFNANLKRAQNVRKKMLLNKNLNAQAITKLGAVQKDLGWQNAEDLTPVFSRTLMLMGEGELSDVMRDDKGFHIIKLVKQRGGKRKENIQAKVRHILINKKDPKAKIKVTKLRNQILAGESFEGLATKHSDDQGSAHNGGVLAMKNTDVFVPSFTEVVNTLALKTLSQPVETEFGWHIIEVLERRNSDQTRELIKTQAKQLVSSKNNSEDLTNWLKTLRDEAFVEYRIKRK